MTRSQPKLLTVVAAGVPVTPSAADRIQVVASVAPEREAVLTALATRPDVLLLPLRNPGALDVVRDAAQRAPATAVVCLTPPGSGEPVIAAMRAGARGFLHDDVTGSDLLRAIRVVASGAAMFGQDAADRLYGMIAQPSPFPELTAREHDVLGLLAAELGNTAIAQRLNLAPKTVRNLVSGIQAKLGTHDRAEVITRARDAGLAREA